MNQEQAEEREQEDVASKSNGRRTRRKTRRRIATNTKMDSKLILILSKA